MKIKIFSIKCPQRFRHTGVEINSIEVFLNKGFIADFFFTNISIADMINKIKKLESKGIKFEGIGKFPEVYSPNVRGYYSHDTLLMLNLLFNDERYVEFEV